jgi:hypothetical protein
MEADAPVDEVDALAARIDAIDDLDAGNHLYGCGRVLTALIRDADVEGVRAHLELLDYHDEDAVSAHQLAMAARLPYKVHYADAAVCRRSREVLLRLVEACDERTLGQCIVRTDDWNPEQSLGRRGPEFPPLDFSFRWGDMPYAVTVLHQFAWDGDVDAVAMVLALPQCTTRLVNITAGRRVNHHAVATPGSFVRELTDEMGPGTTPLHVACFAGRTSVVQLLLRDGRADPNYPNEVGNSPLVTTSAAPLVYYGRLNHCVAECVRALTLDPRTKVDVWYTKTGGQYSGAGVHCHILSRLAKYGALEMAYHVLAALPKLDPHSVKLRDPVSAHTAVLGLDARSPIEQCLCASPASLRTDTLHPMLCFLIEVSNAGGFKRWRAEKTLELMVLRALVTRARKRRRVRAAASMTTVVHRLFNMRDDALFLRVLGYCWFLNPGARVPCAHDYALTRLLKEGKTNDEAAAIISKMGSEYLPGTFSEGFQEVESSANETTANEL